jgi:hypothetical protein
MAPYNPVQALTRMKLWSARRLRFLPPDNIDVDGHCVGAVGRAFLGHSAGFYNATLWLAKARKAGILRKGKPSRYDIVLFSGGSGGHGHVGIADDDRYFYGTDLPTQGIIGRHRINRVWSNVRYQGYVRPEDMHKIGWPRIPAAPDPKPRNAEPVRGRYAYVKPGQHLTKKVRLGRRSVFVKEVQHYLRLPVTGLLDQRTYDAIQSYKRKRAIGRTGNLGPVAYRRITGHK